MLPLRAKSHISDICLGMILATTEITPLQPRLRELQKVGSSPEKTTKLFELLDILSKSLGSATPINIIRATFDGITRLRTAEQVARTRGLSVEEILH
mgnify:CR=1 FL=1